jgi:hypothetical protein
MDFRHINEFNYLFKKIEAEFSDLLRTSVVHQTHDFLG